MFGLTLILKRQFICKARNKKSFDTNVIQEISGSEPNSERKV
jgi:hypothetical protein